MKGRDLFDCNIWADPLKTSVFYRFATSLRQRVREVEPTVTHRFIAQMRDVGKLARVYTQNIDEIEKKIGLSTDLKNGAGTKRRRPNKQSPIESEREGKENTEPLKSEDDPGSSASASAPVSASQDPDESITRNKPRTSLVQDKGVECVFLHGSLHALRCFVCGKLCDWDEDGRESCTLSGEQPECPHCAGATAARQEKGKRALGVGKLRPDIVLYGEEHPQSDLISPIVQHDLSAGPDLLLVLGTSLRVHGLKVMVKEFAKAVHNKGGKVIFINFTKPSESVWGDIIDYWIEWDCDAWVEDLKDRRPQLWLSPEELVELEKQRREEKREAIAEKKKEIEKRRESMIEKKRESLELKRRHTIELSKLRPPPKNPSAMRNDYQCGAYVVWEIFQTLAKIGDRPFDNLGHTPPTPPAPPTPAPTSSSCPEPQSSVVFGPEPRPKAKIKRPRKSAPAALAIVAMENAAMATTKAQAAEKTEAVASVAASSTSTASSPKLKSKPRAKAKSSLKHHGKDQYAKAAKGLARAGKPPTPARLASLCRSPVPSPSVPTPSSVPEPMVVKEEEASIVAAVKTNPRRRKRKVIDGVEVGLPVLPAITRPRPSLPLPTPSPNSIRNDCRHHTSEFPVIANATLSPRGPMLPPLHSNWEHSPPAIIEPMEPNPVVSPQSPLVEIRPHVWKYNSYAMHPMLYSDPLVGLQYQMNYQRPLREPTAKHMEDKTPSPSDQLRREWEIAYELSRMRERR
ncbi:DHS-like NAD/FAD-binding domain-containing protein [Camillea tinctor]|nr:DHS-like NAD/FAD-binding domain-containing protein [Camillea tinctor]